MFDKKTINIFGRDAILVSGLINYSLRDTLECGQCFRHVCVRDEDGYVEYMTVVKGKLIFVGQRNEGELIFYSVTDEELENICVPYFALDTDYDEIVRDIEAHTSSEFLLSAARAARGIRILRQEPWEALFSFIVSQNNNIPRIKKIIRAICREYGDNLAVREGLSLCPLDAAAAEAKLDTDKCLSCGMCYSFPTAEAVAAAPELLLPSHPGFRFKYLLDAAERVASGDIDLSAISDAASYEYTLAQLMRIKGVGEKVASCTALFGFGNLEAFPIDVWMKRAIDTCFDGKLDHTSLGKYAGVAQQYIFHYIRMLSDKNA
ncbi:MAG: DNA glycosylase [Clostridia bacterium]|nr:DNA glycosylase [Clostridia bacterium]